MEQSKIDMFIGTMQGKFRPEDTPTIRTILEKADDSKMIEIQGTNYKDPTIILIFSLFLGMFGVDRFMLGQPILGILKLLSLGGFGIWAIIDWFLVMKTARKINFQKLKRIILGTFA